MSGSAAADSCLRSLGTGNSKAMSFSRFVLGKQPNSLQNQDEGVTSVFLQTIHSPWTPLSQNSKETEVTRMHSKIPKLKILFPLWGALNIFLPFTRALKNLDFSLNLHRPQHRPSQRPNSTKKVGTWLHDGSGTLKPEPTVENDKYHLLVLSKGICLHCADPSAGQGQ